MGGSLFLIKRRCNVYLVPNETAKILSTNQKFTIKFFISTILRKYTFSLFFVSNLFKYNRSNIIHCTYFIILILNLVTRKIKRITTTYIIYIYHIQRNYWSQKTFLNEKSLLNSPLKKPPKFPKLWNPSNFLLRSPPSLLLLSPKHAHRQLSSPSHKYELSVTIYQRDYIQLLHSL